jgi:hypothetical protein
MAYEHLFHDDAGTPVSPEADGWAGWVGATRVRNYCEGNPVLDWLDRHGAAAGFVRDDLLPGYDARTDFAEFLFEKGHAFEAAVIAYLRTRAAVVDVPADEAGARSLARVHATWQAMLEGAEMIYQGVLRNPQDRTYGAPDLLVRSDVLERLFPGTLDTKNVSVPAPALGRPWHYRVVDIKFTTLHLEKSGHIRSDRAELMAQVYLYNCALGRLQGYLPPAAHLLGRGWEQGVENGEPRRGDSCIERLARVDMAYSAPKGSFALATLVSSALAWLRDLEDDGANWSVLPVPSRPDLRPNATGEAGRWSRAIKQIARETGEITLAWQAGPGKRDAALAAGVSRWDDPLCTAELLGITGECLGPMVDRVLDVNRARDGRIVVPEVIRAEADTWAEPGRLEFFVDFETVSNLDDDFSRIPLQNGAPRIFMIGCGHVEAGEWRFACFTADDLGADAEARAIEAWLAHMAEVRERLAPGGEDPLVFHWSPAETSALSNAYNSARDRHRPHSDNWREPRWFDFLNRVMKAKHDHVVVRGAMGFGLKAVAGALYEHGLVATGWGESITDGMGAMTAAWRCNVEAAALGVPMISLPLLQEVASYNEVDCKVMWETISALRARAARPLAVVPV